MSAYWSIFCFYFDFVTILYGVILISACIFNSFVGRQKRSAQMSGPEDISQAPSRKRLRPANNTVAVSPALIPELERAYEGLYLCTPGSLLASYTKGTSPPVRNSPHKYLAAINSTPGWGRSISKQLARIKAIREQGHVSILLTDCDN